MVHRTRDFGTQKAIVTVRLFDNRVFLLHQKLQKQSNDKYPGIGKTWTKWLKYLHRSFNISFSSYLNTSFLNTSFLYMP